MVRSGIGRTLQHLRRMVQTVRTDSDKRPGLAAPKRAPGIILSIVVSFLLWFTVSMRAVYPLTVNLPTEVVNLPADRSLEDLPPSSIRVQVQGEGWQLLRLYSNRQTIPVEAVAGETNLLEIVTMSLPRDLEVQAVTPAQCDIRLGVRQYARIPISLRSEIKPAVTHDTTEAYRLEPDSVTVYGSRRLLGSLKSWPTERVTADNVRAPISRTVALLDTLQGLVVPELRTTTLNVSIEQFTEVRREVEVRILDRPLDNRGVSLSPNRVTAYLYVPLSQATEAAESPEIYATVSFAQITTDTLGAVAPILHVPPTLANRRVTITPDKLKYFVIVN